MRALPDRGRGLLGLLGTGAVSVAVAVGLSVLVVSRGPVIGIQLAFSPLLIGMGFLGGARQATPEVAVKRIADLPPAGDVHVALATAVLVAVAWRAAALGLGA